MAGMYDGSKVITSSQKTDDGAHARRDLLAGSSP